MGTSVLMLTCSKYSAVRPPFEHGFRKYWPDCPWPLRIVSDDRVWSDGAIAALKKLGTKTVLLTLDDHWLTGMVDTSAMKDFAEHVLRGRADHIRLYDSGQPSDGAFKFDPRLFVFARRARYRACLQPSFYDVKAMLKLLRSGETAWQWEMRSAKRTRDSKKYVCVRNNRLFPYALGGDWGRGPVVKGMWTKAARLYATCEGLSIDFSRHPGES